MTEAHIERLNRSQSHIYSEVHISHEEVARNRHWRPEGGRIPTTSWREICTAENSDAMMHCNHRIESELSIARAFDCRGVHQDCFPEAA